MFRFRIFYPYTCRSFFPKSKMDLDYRTNRYVCFFVSHVQYQDAPYDYTIHSVFGRLDIMRIYQAFFRQEIIAEKGVDLIGQPLFFVQRSLNFPQSRPLFELHPIVRPIVEISNLFHTHILNKELVYHVILLTR